MFNLFAQFSCNASVVLQTLDTTAMKLRQNSNKTFNLFIVIKVVTQKQSNSRPNQLEKLCAIVIAVPNSAANVMY